MKYAKVIFILICIAGQFVAFEGFERFYYKFEDRYNKYTSRIGLMPITKIFDEEAFEALNVKTYGEIRYDLDEYGFRTMGLDYDDKRGKRFIFVGSRSMGYGTGVPEDRTFPAAFDRKLGELRPDAEYQVINANKGAVTLSTTFLELKDVMFSRIRPDFVIVGAYISNTAYPRHAGNTLEERVLSRDVSAFGGTTVKKNGMVIVSQVPHSDLWNEIYSRSYAMGKFLAYVDIKMAEAMGALGSAPEIEVDNVGYVDDLKTYLDRHGVELSVVLLPKLGGEQDSYRAVVNEEMKELCARRGIPCLDIDPLRPAQDYTFVSDGHYSAYSNELVGGDIARWVHELLDDDFRLKK